MTREEAIKYIKNLLKGREDKRGKTEIDEALEMAIQALEQEPKTGHREYNDIYDHYLCGNCKTVVMDYDNYCPNCGARMVEPQKSEDCRDCKKWEDCPCGKEGHESETSQGYSIGGCKDFEPQESEVRNENNSNTK